MYAAQQQLTWVLSRQLRSPPPSALGPLAAPGPGQLAPLPDGSVLWLGETCSFHLSLRNGGATSAHAAHQLSLKVELSVEGGSSTVLYEQPLASLAPLGEHAVVASFDAKEAGALVLIASAVYSDPSNERKYCVQFHKLRAASPVSVRTRVRALPHTAAAASPSSSSLLGRSRCFLEVAVANAMDSPMCLHALRLLPAAGLAAVAEVTGAALCGSGPGAGEAGEQQQQLLLLHGGLDAGDAGDAGRSSGGGGSMGGGSSAGAGGRPAHKSGPAAEPAGTSSSNSDVHLQPDTCDAAGGGDNRHAAEAPSAPGSKAAQPGKLQNGQVQQQDQAQAAAQQPGQQQGVTLAPQCSHCWLWSIDHTLPGPGLAAAAPDHSSSSGAAAYGPPGGGLLGRLELHWSSSLGKTGRLLTQPLTGPLPASRLLLQLTALGDATPGAPTVGPAGTAAAAAVCLQGQLFAGRPATATLTLTAAGGPGHEAGLGSLLVLHTDVAGASAAPRSSQGRPGSTSGSSSSAQPGAATAAATAAAAAAGSAPAVVVQGPRTQRAGPLAPGGSCSVTFQLLPLRRGWARLPTFVAVCEADGRLLDSVHDVRVLVL